MDKNWNKTYIFLLKGEIENKNQFNKRNYKKTNEDQIEKKYPKLGLND
jgi:hypothetical protein